tara:strand:- start:3891 stop:4895 length:1005 start_codon:yes stop_codon:yes gene_type:complete
MLLNNAAVYVCSMNNLNERLKYYGNASLAELNALKLIYKVASYASTDEALRRLDAMVSELQRGTNGICMDRIYGVDFMPDYNDPLNPPEDDEAGVTEGTATLGDVTINITEEFITTEDSWREPPSTPYVKIYTFTEDDFWGTFVDTNSGTSGQRSEMILTSLPTGALLKYDGVTAIANQYVNDPTLLTFWKNTNDEINETFTWIISSANQNQVWSNEATMTVNNVAVGNSSATIDDNSIYTENNVLTVLTTAMFTENYLDPEGDDLDAIRIDAISTSNQGSFLYNGLSIAVGQIITKSDLDAGMFTHAGAQIDTVSSDVIEISVRDSGSLIWVN